MTRSLTTPRLSRLAARSVRSAETEAPPEAAEPEERCELCGLGLPERHRHLLDIEASQLLCACQACSLLMDHQAAGGNHYRLIPQDPRRIVDLELPDHRWAALAVPVELAFFVDTTPRQGVAAYYPGAMGATEAHPDVDAWRTVCAENPLLADLTPDVEALLVRRTSEGRHGWVVPIDHCFRLTGRIRSRWRGLSGGSEVWQEIEDFFRELDEECLTVDRHGKRVRGAETSNFTSPNPEPSNPEPSNPEPSNPEEATP